MSDRESYILHCISSTIKEKDPSAEIILFGSHARGTANMNSDWDILILLNMPRVNKDIEIEYRNKIYTIELEIGEPISTFVYAKNDWETKHSVTPLYQNIKREGVNLA